MTGFKSNPSPTIRELVFAATFAAISISLPVLFHLLSLGSTFLPMFLPISMAAFILPLRLSISVAIVAPFISSVLTGMPPLAIPPIGIVMILELIVLCFLNYILYQKFKLNIFLAATIAVLIDRIFYLFMSYMLAEVLKLPQMTFAFYSIIKTLPGCILLITIIPGLTIYLRKIMNNHET